MDAVTNIIRVYSCSFVVLANLVNLVKMNPAILAKNKHVHLVNLGYMRPEGEILSKMIVSFRPILEIIFDGGMTRQRTPH
jgi:hypothetical protein